LRCLGAAAGLLQHVQIKQRDRGFDEAAMGEDLVVPSAVGRGWR
jgi:hypothetical protein